MQLATVEKNPFSSWLQSSRNYRDGLALLAGSSCSKVVLKMLEAGPGPFNSPKLAQVIQKLSNAWIAPVSKAIPKNVAEFLIPVPDTQIAQPASPAKLLAIRKEIADTWKQMCHYHGARAGAANDAQRYYFANRLMYLDDQRQHLFGQVDHFEQTGLFFDELPENQPKPYDLEQEIKNVMSYRAKKKTELKKTANPDQRDRLKKRIAEYDQQLEQLRAQRHA